ncbi:hypothetical protein [Segniliparus rugosus]|nr:hypothetical protein [Segniliparus rugosus]
MSSEEELMVELREAIALGHGRTQIEAMELVLAKAQSQGQDVVEHAVRVRLIEAYTFGGETEKLFSAFAWCLAAYERGERQHEFRLLWAFKWVAHGFTRFPQIPLAQGRAMHDEMERRFREAGQSMQPVHQYRCQFAQHIGDPGTAAEEFRLWGLSTRGALSNCPVCDPTARVAYHNWTRDYEESVRVARAALNSGKRCVSEPQAMMTLLLEPCLKIGRPDQGRRAHLAAYPALRNNRFETGLVSEHIRFCAHVGDADRAFELAQQHLDWLDGVATPSEDMRLSTACAVAFRVAASAGRKGELVRRPAYEGRPAGETEVSALADELEARAFAIAARFDERNQSAEQSNGVREWLDV